VVKGFSKSHGKISVFEGNFPLEGTEHFRNEANDAAIGTETRRPANDSPAQDPGWIKRLRPGHDETRKAAAKQTIGEHERAITNNQKK
jgi:hypothetical protein